MELADMSLSNRDKIALTPVFVIEYVFVSLLGYQT